MTVGHLNTFFAQVAGNLKSQILKSSNSRRLPGEGMLKFRIDRYIKGNRGRLYSKGAFTDNRCGFFGVTVNAFGCWRLSVFT